MSGVATGLDHVGIAVPNLPAAAAAWESLGFTVQPLAAHMHNGAPTGTGNRNIMLRQGYIELLATIDPAKPSATIARFLAHHTGIHVLTLATADAEAAAARLARAGFQASIAHATRAADPTLPDGPQAAFARIPLAEADPRLQLIQHLTPGLVWQEQFLSHRNGAEALLAVLVAADPPATFAARLARAAGLPIVPDPLGRYALPLPSGRVCILPPAEAARSLPGAALPTQPGGAGHHILGIALRTGDRNQAAARLPGATTLPDGTVVAHATGVTVLFQS